jgi:hypothetical protein
MRVYAVPPPSIPEYQQVYPTAVSEKYWEGALKQLDICCQFKPTHKLTVEGKTVIVSSLELKPYRNVTSELRSLKGVLMNKTPDSNLSSEELEEMRNLCPQLPLFPDLDGNSYFSKFQFELATVLYRDEVERFLGYMHIYALRAGLKGFDTPATSDFSLPPSEVNPQEEVTPDKGKGKAPTGESLASYMTTEATPLADPKRSLIPATPGTYLDQAQQTALFGTPLPATTLIGSEDIKKQRRQAGKFAPLGSSISTPIKSRLTNFDMEATQLSNVAEEDADISEVSEPSYLSSKE